MGYRKRAQDAAPTRRQPNMHFAAVGLAWDANHESLCFHPSHQFDGAVVTNLQPLCQISNAYLVTCRHALYRQQQLMLLRLYPGFCREILAERDELAELVTKFG